jgi:phosphoribosylglycinamide formyltransferase-1
MEALILAARSPEYPGKISLVLSNQSDAGGLSIARSAGIPTKVIDHREFAGCRADHEVAIASALRALNIEIICLAGYMRLLTPFFVTEWRERILNIHPSLLPSFPGLKTHSRVLAAGTGSHGCSVHLVTQDMDSGPILAQATVPVLAGDTEAILAQRVLHKEHEIYPSALAGFAVCIASTR